MPPPLLLFQAPAVTVPFPIKAPRKAPVLAGVPAAEAVEEAVLRSLRCSLPESPSRVALWARMEWRLAQASSSERHLTAGREPAIARGRARAPHACRVCVFVFVSLCVCACALGLGGARKGRRWSGW